MVSGGMGSGGNSTDSIIAQIVRKVADYENIDPVELNPPLGEVIDPDALEALFEDPRKDDLRITFTYQDYEISVRPGEGVQIHPFESPSS